ncbi:hypothetical protein SAMN05421856_11273 [Chryseobacterium taichungense]|uniref:Uncharacterized protein n=1 Tax=Chryseobacterium taichungense TaxID=295069 RepID=A0A1H8DCG8_9FLAO|nr:hypothetical protein [Chryseobacterium taichungense]SEN04278.1 hypothetical protein SAMN05421856_11273 [Chryseobacterium taichungense]
MENSYPSNFDIFSKEALEVVNESFLVIKTFTDNSSDIEKLYKMIEVEKYSLYDNLKKVFYPIHSITQPQEIKDQYKDFDFVNLFDSYFTLYEKQCIDYLRKQNKSKD